MKKRSNPEIKEIIKSDPVLQKLRAKSRRIDIDCMVLRNHKERIIPKKLLVLELKSDKIEEKWKKRIKQLGLPYD